MRFRYLLDPLFLLCVATYAVNRLVLKAIWKEGFVHEHLNDLICIPFWVPIMLFAQRKLGLRDGDDPPRPGEIVIALVTWSWVFEIVLPATGWLGNRCVSDYRDIAYYSLGGLLAGLFWGWWYGRSADEPQCEGQGQGHPPADAPVAGGAEGRDANHPHPPNVPQNS